MDADRLTEIGGMSAPALPHLDLSEAALKHLADAMGAAHGYAVALALVVKDMSSAEITSLGQASLGQLHKGGLLSQSEAHVLHKMLDVLDGSEDLAAHEHAIAACAGQLADCGPVAAMLVAIARDSIARAAQHHGHSGHSPHRKLGRRLRTILSVAADVAAGAAGAAAGGTAAAAAASPTGPGAAAAGVAGAVLVGGIAATAASAAVLTLD